jgi:hypothetical protein
MTIDSGVLIRITTLRLTISALRLQRGFNRFSSLSTSLYFQSRDSSDPLIRPGIRLPMSVSSGSNDTL